MQTALNVLKAKGILITEKEEEGALAAILLHDVGHGPYSHALEYVMTDGVDHEFFSQLIMQRLNDEFTGQLDVAISIFNDTYEKQFLHQLVSSQLDVDRLDYLARDSFFSGVYEGRISTERIIAMLNVSDDRIVVEEKGLYSIEKYIISRRLMYWQVYLHKTAVAAEEMLVSIIQRARHLLAQGHKLTASSSLSHFLSNDISQGEFYANDLHIKKYCSLDDNDVLHAIKEWCNDSDFVLSFLCNSLLSRKLFRIEMKKKKISDSKYNAIKEDLIEATSLSEEDLSFLLRKGSVNNVAYTSGKEGIFIMNKSGKVNDLTKVSDQLTKANIGKRIERNYLCYPKDFSDIRNQIQRWK